MMLEEKQMIRLMIVLPSGLSELILEIVWDDVFRLKFGDHIAVVGKLAENIFVDRDKA